MTLPPADTINALAAALPRHKAGLKIEHNPHHADYVTVAGWIEARHLISDDSEPDWPSPEARQRAIDTNDVWVMLWYPDTLVGHMEAAAPTLAELLAFAAE